jgi:ribosome maturation factor RimP
MSEQRKTAERVRDLVEDVIVQQGYELVEVELANGPGRPVLRLYIDSATAGAGIGVDDCAKVSRTLSDMLDVEELISDTYTLEVSSPGVFRPLRKPEHFDRALGERVKVKIFAKQDGRKVFTGTLKARDGNAVSVDVDGTVYTLELADVAKANLEPLL